MIAGKSWPQRVLAGATLAVFILFIISLAAPRGAWGLQESKPDTKPGEAAPKEAGAEVSFSKDVLALFKEQKCTVCHRGENPSGLDLMDEVAYKSLVNAKTNDKESLMVKPGDPEASYLYVKLIGPGRDGTIMPPKGKMEDAEINKVRLWIQQGAKNN